MTVFVVQKQVRYDPETKQTVDRFPALMKAEKWGEIVFILNPSAHPFEFESVLGSMHEALSGFNDEDYLILIGSPMLMGMATAVAAYYNEGRIRFLQWSPREGDYAVISTEIF